MYIINPFRKQGMTAQDLTSTHPPISERIRILHAMSGASYEDYSRAYQEIRHTNKEFIPAAAAATVGSVSLRRPSSEGAEKLDEVERVRDTNNALWNVNKYRTINCACGTRLRVPPTYKQAEITCPHCGRINPV